MKAIQIQTFGGPDVMQYLDLPDPVPNSDQILIEVTSIGINYADTHQTENSYLSPQTLPLVPGIEVVGLTSDGRRVLSPVGGGGYAQLALAHKSACIDIPDRVTDGEALAMMVQGSTAFHLLKTMGHIKRGESVVIHAAAGGVGVIAIQLAKLWGGYVIAVTSTPAKDELAMSLGADVCVRAGGEDLAKELIAANNGKPVDIVLEMIGGETFSQSMAALAPFGRLITFGMASRMPPRPITTGELMHGTKTVSGFWLSHCFGRKDLLNDVISELFGLIIGKKIRPIIGETFALSDAGSAHKVMRSRSTVGKILLDPAK